MPKHLKKAKKQAKSKAHSLAASAARSVGSMESKLKTDNSKLRAALGKVRGGFEKIQHKLAPARPAQPYIVIHAAPHTTEQPPVLPVAATDNPTFSGQPVDAFDGFAKQQREYDYYSA
jgi:hypothetical protein